MENKKKRDIIIDFVMKIFWVFLIGSLIGCVVELIVCLVQKGYIEPRQGLIYGPFIPVYGMGAVCYYLFAHKVQDIKKVFFLSMLLGGAIEYLCSYLQEMFFGTISWDYSQLLFNLNGRTSLLHCLYWGAAGILFIKLIYPKIEQMNIYLGKITFRYITAVLVTFMVFNISISWLAAQRQQERIDQIEAESRIDTFLDKYYPDQKMNYIFSNQIIKAKKIPEKTQELP